MEEKTASWFKILFVTESDSSIWFPPFPVTFTLESIVGNICNTFSFTISLDSDNYKSFAYCPGSLILLPGDRFVFIKGSSFDATILCKTVLWEKLSRILEILINVIPRNVQFEFSTTA